MAKHILFICHRIPFPPNKGEKIRSFHMLRHLAERHDISLAFLFDDPEDRRHIAPLEDLVFTVVFDYLPATAKKIRSLLALAGQAPLTVPYFYSSKLQQEIDELLAGRPVDAVFCSSSPSAEYIFRSRHYRDRLRQVPWFMDLIDVDSQKWQQYAQSSPWPFSWVYRREATTLLAYERRIEREFSHLFVTSEVERDLFLSLIRSEKISAIANGVDLAFFNPSHRASLDVDIPGPAIVFTGAMDYKPNIDGVLWFADKVFPLIRQHCPSAVFLVVGSKPAAAVRSLADRDNIRVTGFVHDVRDYLATADICVAPLLIARGIQNKVLEAMAMGKPLVCTPQALEGIEAQNGEEAMVEKEPQGFADQICRLLSDRDLANAIGQRARRLMERRYSWEQNLNRLDAVLQKGIKRIP
ncbi:MAG: TIGR03087 family PEP-CTERM/XrtA system glycosyltransferase [Thermodesulfobacteriota bacterium]